VGAKNLFTWYNGFTYLKGKGQQRAQKV